MHQLAITALLLLASCDLEPDPGFVVDVPNIRIEYIEPEPVYEYYDDDLLPADEEDEGEAPDPCLP